MKTLIESLTLSVEAATYLGGADDRFGAIPGLFVVLDDNHTYTIAAIRKLAEDMLSVSA